MDLKTEYLGLTLSNPLVPSASPLSRSLDAAKALEDSGASAIIMYSLFEEAVRAEEEAMVRFLHHQDTGCGEADSVLQGWKRAERERQRLVSLDWQGQPCRSTISPIRS